ncbi:MAG: porin family protein [Bacteriovoracaceae bacterium]|nr:porin family protein [Bacteriovoracaceae bacterium]
MLKIKNKKSLGMLTLITLLTQGFALADTVVVNSGGNGGIEQTNEAVLQQPIENSQMNINGYVKEQPQATDAELEYLKSELQKQQGELQVNKEKEKKYKELTDTTEKLADATEDYLEEKKNSQSTIEAYNKRIKCLMEEGRDPKDCDERNFRYQDQVQVQQAAVVAPAPSQSMTDVKDPSSTYGKFDVIRVTPYSGVTTYRFNNVYILNNNVESRSNFGVKAESNLDDRWAFGIGANRTETNAINAVLNGFGVFPMSMNNYAFEAYAKFFLLNSGRFRGYVGGGAIYNKAEFQTSYPIGGGPMGPIMARPTIDSNFVTGSIATGADIAMTPSWGLNLEIKYARGFGKNFNTQTFINNPDQFLLREFANQVQNSDAMSLNIGATFNF